MKPDDLLGDAAVDAAIGALANRNKELLLRMDPGEREAMLAHWRGVALDVLTAARGALDAPAAAPDGETRGRAVIVIEDGADRALNVRAAFFPELDEAGDHFLGTAAQAAAVELLRTIASSG